MVAPQGHAGDTSSGVELGIGQARAEAVLVGAEGSAFSMVY